MKVSTPQKVKVTTSKKDSKEEVRKEPVTLCAVYGTLKKGFGNHRVLQDSKLVGTFKTDPKFTMLNISGAFPGVIKGGTTPITMEVFEVKTDQIRRDLDSLEGYSKEYLAQSMYIKETIPTPFGEASVYYWNRAKEAYKAVSTGNWTND